MAHLESDPSRPPAHGPEDPLLVRVERLEEMVAALQRRLDRFEGLAAGVSEPALTPETGSLAPAAGEGEEAPSAVNMLGLAGRALLILGGAFLIRAMTEGGALPKGVGVLAGTLYALVWAALALRGRRSAATLHLCLSTSLILPLIYEAATRFEVLSPGWAAAALGAFTVGFLWISWRRDLHGAAWTALLGSLAAGFILMARTSALVPFTGLFLAEGGGVLWLTYGRRWHGLRWPAALMADLSVLMLTSYAATPGGPPEPLQNLSLGWSMALALGLAAVYVGSIATRVLQRVRKVNVFEGVQTLLAVGVGFGGALRVALASGSTLAPFGIAALIAGGACYAVAFAFVEQETEIEANFIFFTTLALVFTLLGGVLVAPAAVLVPILGALGALALFFGVRQHRWVLRMHGAAYFTAMAFALGIHRITAQAFWAPPPLPPPEHPILLAGFAAGVILAHVYAATQRAKAAMAWWQRLPDFALGLWALAALGSLGVLAAGPQFPEAASIAALRTSILAGLTLGAAFLSRWIETSEMGWFVHPLLGLTALKMLMEDLPAGRPLPLAIGFACLGLALVLAPRARRAKPPQA